MHRYYKIEYAGLPTRVRHIDIPHKYLFDTEDEAYAHLEASGVKPVQPENFITTRRVCWGDPGGTTFQFFVGYALVECRRDKRYKCSCGEPLTAVSTYCKWHGELT